jgi:Raf kinase inhibitor-like YbhB/YbcL family protein
VPFRLTSSAFIEGGAIPREYTCDGDNVSPALSWSGVPAGADSLMLLVDDPDAREFVHWIVLDLPAKPTGVLPRALDGVATPPRQGKNDFGNVGWGGPCPPSGTHRYLFVLYALAARLGVASGATGTVVRAALGKSTIVGQATLEATYRRG